MSFAEIGFDGKLRYSFRV